MRKFVWFSCVMIWILFSLIINIIFNHRLWFREWHTGADWATTQNPTRSERWRLLVSLHLIIGSRVVVQYVQKRGHGPRAPHDSCDCGKRINGIAQLRPNHYKRLAKKDKSVSRPYGGVLCGGCVKSRIIRAFLLEEIKTIKRAKQAAKKWSSHYLNSHITSITKGNQKNKKMCINKKGEEVGEIYEWDVSFGDSVVV